jgi:predicted transcriptional regulator
MNKKPNEKEVLKTCTQLNEDIKILSNIIYYKIINEIDNSDKEEFKELKKISESTIESLKLISEKIEQLSKKIVR